jgi:hypothetical protein
MDRIDPGLANLTRIWKTKVLQVEAAKNSQGANNNRRSRADEAVVDPAERHPTFAECFGLELDKLRRLLETKPPI